MGDSRTIALLGQPNSGKSTIFNTLTGMHQHTGNWPGKTVEKKEGSFTYNDVSYNVVDLPGSYSLSANSEEEIVTRDYITKEKVDLVLVLADASQLERSMYMLADYAGLEVPVMLVLTMMDVAGAKGKTIDTAALSKKLGIDVVGLVAYDKKKYDDFLSLLEKAVGEGKQLAADDLYSEIADSAIGDKFKEIEDQLESVHMENRSNDWIAAKLLENDADVRRELAIKGIKIDDDVDMGAVYTSDARFKWIEGLLAEAVKDEKEPSELLTRFDRIAIGPRSGIWVAIGMMVLALAAAMIVAGPIMGIGGAIPKVLNPLFDKVLGAAGVSEGIIHFIKSTIVTSLGWVVSMAGFIFAINFVFGAIEEAGYMARVSYVFDRSMGHLGLQGKSIMPMFMGFGCTMGSASGAKVLDTYGQRILTIAVAWAIPCGATFTVVPVLANAFFGGTGALLVLLLILAIMFLHIFITAKIFGSRLSPAKDRTGIVMELPPYHKPRWGYLLKHSLITMWDVFKKAFTIELIVCILFYFLSYSKQGIEGSVLYSVGTFIEPVTRFFGLTWKTFMSMVAGMISKEAVLGVISAIFSNSGNVMDATTGLMSSSNNIAEVVAESIPRAEALAFLVAVTFNVPCLQAVVSTYNETHSAKWTVRIGAYYIVTALVLAFVVYHIAALVF